MQSSLSDSQRSSIEVCSYTDSSRRSTQETAEQQNQQHLLHCVHVSSAKSLGFLFDLFLKLLRQRFLSHVKMGKKRGKDKSSRDEEEIDLTVPSCRHIKKGTDQTLMKKLVGISDLLSCQDCKEEEDEEDIDAAQPQDSEGEEEKEKEATGMWMCLKCGHRGCGRYSENQHAIKHYETPRSDPHCLVVSLDNWSVWCYICDEEVQYSKTGHLAQLVSNIKKQASAGPVNRPQKGGKEEVIVTETEEETPAVASEERESEENGSRNDQKNGRKESAGKSQSCSSAAGNSAVPVRGLSNLGNTCFFNAVIQNLSQTQPLRETLNKVVEEKASVDVEPAASVDLEPLVVQLDQPGSLTLAMCQLLGEIQQSKKGVITPRELFAQVCKKAARFKGFQQQDSQELLRYLLDGMRAEEHKRVSAGLMEALKQSSKGTDGEQLKKIVKEYEKHGFPRNFVDQVFGGELTSTIMCQQCKTVSVVTEMFLDLSLPVSDEAYRKKNPKKGVQKSIETSQDGRSSPASSSTNDNIPTGAGSKYQQKKAKKHAKKQAKHQKRQQKLENRVTLDSLTDQTESEQTSAAEDAKDGEDAPSEGNEETPLSEPDPAAASVSGQDQSVELQKEEDNDSETDGDAAATSSVSNRFTVLSDGQQSQDSAACDDISNIDREEEVDSELVDKMEKVTLDDAFVEDSDATERGAESEDDAPEAKEYTVINQDPDLAFHTLAARTTPEKQECSVQSCLFQFTEVETLTQSNSLLCVTCTKQQLRKDKGGESKKNIYTDALKQMLISSLPPVLTLHLKRFQQNGYSICKVNRHVHFPMILDLAPYCATKCKNFSEGDAQILYSLYGIVEHSGTMRSGHYTAYVKVRPNCPRPSSNGLASEGDSEPSVGSWFHISDTSVQPVSESKVQSCQAYLLFYERII